MRRAPARPTPAPRRPGGRRTGRRPRRPAAAPYDALVDLTGCAADDAAGEDGLQGWLPWLQRRIAGGSGLLALGVTRGLERLGDATVNPSGATRAGLYRMLQSEYGKIRSRHVDLDPAADDATAVRQLLAELAAPDDEGEVALRGDGRFRPRLRPLPPDAAGSPAAFPPTPSCGSPAAPAASACSPPGTSYGGTGCASSS
ncbi:hypothetical protein O1L55_09680 [Streptomyces albulus]|nr:hypothetical protein [Streptomyces noursei]